MNKELKQALINLTDKRDKVYSVVATVDVVNDTEKLCDCTPIDGSAPLLNVKLMADNKTGMYIIPKDGSTVIVTMLNKYTGYVAMFSEINEIQLNGDNNGGVVKIDELKIQFDAMVNGFKAAIGAGFAALSGLDSGASSAAFNSAAASVSLLNKTPMENQIVKHGE